MQLNIFNTDYSVWTANPIGEVKIHEGNPFNLTTISTIDIMGIKEKTNNPFFKTTLKYPNIKKDRSLEMVYVTEYKVQSQIDLKDTKSENLKSLLTELHFRHHTHIHQFLHRLWEKDVEQYPFPPYTLNLLYSLEYVLEQLSKTESLNN